jgi:NADPH-dependent curcumin reductase CurA
VVFQVLKQEYPKGMDLIYESVGGQMFETCMNALAVYGRMVVIGMISQVYFSTLYFFP